MFAGRPTHDAPHRVRALASRDIMPNGAHRQATRIPWHWYRLIRAARVSKAETPLSAVTSPLPHGRGSVSSQTIPVPIPLNQTNPKRGAICEFSSGFGNRAEQICQVGQSARATGAATKPHRD